MFQSFLQLSPVESKRYTGGEPKKRSEAFDDLFEIK
jgi:hypothetical protein